MAFCEPTLKISLPYSCLFFEYYLFDFLLFSAYVYRISPGEPLCICFWLVGAWARLGRHTHSSTSIYNCVSGSAVIAKTSTCVAGGGVVKVIQFLLGIMLSLALIKAKVIFYGFSLISHRWSFKKLGKTKLKFWYLFNNLLAFDHTVTIKRDENWKTSLLLRLTKHFTI